MATQKPSKTIEELMVYHLTEQTRLIRSINGWVTFFGVLTILSLILWASFLWIF